MTLWTIGLGIGLTLLFAITNAVSDQRGSTVRYKIRLKKGIKVSFQKVHKGDYAIKWGDEKE